MSDNYKKMNRQLAMNILGLSSDYTEADLRTNYRRKMMKNHPDHHGDEKLASEINLAYEYLKEHRTNDIKNMVVGYEESLPKWLGNIYKIIEFLVEDIDIYLMVNNMPKEEVDKKIKFYRNEIIKRLTEIEDTFCIYMGITKNDLIDNGYHPINNSNVQYNIKDIYNKLVLSYTKLFKKRIISILNKYNNNPHYNDLKDTIDSKIEKLNEQLLNKKLNDLTTDLDNYLTYIFNQYEKDYNLVIELEDNYSDLLEDNIEDIKYLYSLCSKKEFSTIYNNLITKLKKDKKEQIATLLVFNLNRKLSYVLSTISSLQETIRLNKLYSILLGIIEDIELTEDIVCLINNISVSNMEKDITDIIDIYNIKVGDIYVPRFRNDLVTPFYVSCKLNNQEYFLKLIYTNGNLLSVEETEYDGNKYITIHELLGLSTFVGGGKSTNLDSENYVIYEYNDSNLNRFGLILNKDSNTLESYGSKKYISYTNESNKPHSELSKYQDIDTLIEEITRELTPYIKKYLYENIVKNNRRSR